MNWERTRLDRVASEVRVTVDPKEFGDEEVDHYSIPTLEENGRPDVQRASEIESAKQRLRGGEVLVSRLNPRKARVVRVERVGARPALCSGEFVVLRPEGISARFLEYALLAESTRQFLDGAVQSVTRSHQRVRPEVLMKMNLAVPSPSEQRAIADFLDRETARIDALIEKKQRMIELVDERLWSLVDARFAEVNEPMQPLGRSVASVCDGPFGSWLTSAHYSNEGARVIRLGNIGRTEFKDHDQAFIPVEHFNRLQRHEVMPGDLLVAGLGDARNALGRACVAPPGLGLAIVKADCFRVRLDETRLLSAFVAWWLSSSRGGSLVAEAIRGSTRQRMNLSSVSHVPIAIPRLHTQREILSTLDQAKGAILCTKEKLSDQVGLLGERRQALVTAAVTGGLVVGGVVA